jgi:hypothetical protein
LFEGARHDLRAAMAEGAGGRNVIKAGLAADIDFAAGLERFADVVGCVEGAVVRRL